MEKQCWHLDMSSHFKLLRWFLNVYYLYKIHRHFQFLHNCGYIPRREAELVEIHIYFVNFLTYQANIHYEFEAADPLLHVFSDCWVNE